MFIQTEQTPNPQTLKFLPGKAINLGIKHSKGNYICCLSAHCIPYDNLWLYRLKKNLNSKVKIIELDLNLISRENKKYDIIISNPPYIPPIESDLLDKNVKYEPDIALFTPKDNPLYFYEKIFEFASLNLSNNGIIYLEINPNYTKEFNQLLTNYSVNHVNFKDDFRGKKRLAKVIF